jgi:hypothetical protein
LGLTFGSSLPGIETVPERHFSSAANPASSFEARSEPRFELLEKKMSKTISGGCSGVCANAVLMFAAALLTCATPAAAAMDCGKMLDSHTAEINKMTKAAPEKRAALTRMAVSGYDSCMAGDMFSAEKFFKMIMDNAGG